MAALLMKFVIHALLCIILEWLISRIRIRRSIWREMLFAIWLGSISVWISPYFARLCFFVAFRRLEIVCFEIVIGELISFVHRFAPAPQIGEIKELYWERVAAVRSCNGYDTWQFYEAIVCDSGPDDDGFWPDHVSTVLMVEHRRLCSAMRSFTIWQVSLFNGDKKKIKAFVIFDRFTDGRLFARQPYFCHFTKCFQSHGVLFIRDCVNSLHVYDTIYKKSAEYKLRHRCLNDTWYHRCTMSISCLRRQFNGDGSVRGWRIRWINVTITGMRASVTNEIYELEGKGRMTLISHESIDFGTLVRDVRYVRTSRGKIGVMALQNTPDSPAVNGPILFFNETTQDYTCLAGIDDLRKMDAAFAAYIFSPQPIRSAGCSSMRPAIFNAREAVQCYSNGAVFRTEFRPSTLKYSAAKTFFRSNPGLRNRFTADEFRRFTGIGGLEGHFG